MRRRHGAVKWVVWWRLGSEAGSGILSKAMRRDFVRIDDGDLRTPRR